MSLDQDRGRVVRAAALAMDETTLRRSVDRLLEQCAKEVTGPQVPGYGMLHVSEIYMLLGLAPGPDYSRLESEIT